jgi:D-3-phosphoglycerate dehydrogenase
MDMEKFRIKTMNKIAQEGLALLDEEFLVDPDEKNPHGILVRSSQVETDAYPELLAVARAGAGVNNITVDKATEHGICVFNTPGANANAVAELLFTMLGIWMRNIHQGIEFCKGLASLQDEAVTEAVEARKAAFRGVELAGKTLGVIGIGKIGVRVANGGLQRQMEVIAFDPYPALENIHALSYEVKLARTLGEVIQKADIITVHVPLNKKTSGYINKEIVAQMRHGAILINVLVSPHLGASTEESEENCACLAVSELKDYLRYGTIGRSVNFPTVESIPSGACHARFIMINTDIPGMIGYASNIIGKNGINIASYMNESNGSIGYNIIDLEASIPPAVVAEIEAHPDVIRTRILACHK